MTLGERIKKLRKALSLTQQGFADRIGMKRNTIGLVETGRNNISDQAIMFICREFRVNETWLRTGKGEMFTDTDNSLLDQLAAEHGLDGAQRAIIKNFLSLPNEYRAAVVHIVRSLADGSAAAQSAPAVTAEELAIYERVRAIKEKETDPLSPDAPLSDEERAMIQRMRTAKEAQERSESLLSSGETLDAG